MQSNGQIKSLVHLSLGSVVAKLRTNITNPTNKFIFLLVRIPSIQGNFMSHFTSRQNPVISGLHERGDFISCFHSRQDPVISMLRAKIATSTGNFDSAVAAAERAVKLDPDNCAAIKTLKQVRALANARTRGNELFKSGDFGGAEKAYSEGLENPLGKDNAFLLSNRAAVRSKQGHWEEALADADIATRACPSYRWGANQWVPSGMSNGS